MTAIFHHRLLNPPWSDPVLLCRRMRGRNLFLCDAGTLSALSPRELTHISHIFISHMHMDHFMDLDRVLRANLMQEKIMHVYGPEGITQQCLAKLHAYTWNVSHNLLLRLAVHEIGERVSEKRFDANHGFREDDAYGPAAGTVTLRGNYHQIGSHDDVMILALVQDHGIPCLAFRIEHQQPLGLNRSLLRQRRLPLGDWLEQLRLLYRNNAPDDAPLVIDGPEGRTVHLFGSLKPLLIEKDAYSIGYLVDASPRPANVEKLTAFFSRTSDLYCETPFLQRDLELAQQRQHLTAAIAGRMARDAGVKRLIPCHFSPRYEERYERLVDEAMTAFCKSEEA